MSPSLIVSAHFDLVIHHQNFGWVWVHQMTPFGIESASMLSCLPVAWHQCERPPMGFTISWAMAKPVRYRVLPVWWCKTAPLRVAPLLL